MSKARELAALGNAYSDGALSNRNLIINGAMQVAQRGTSVSASSAGYATVDRWRHAIANAGVFTVSQDTTGPDGFSNSLKCECTTADASLAASDYIRLEHRIEAQNLQQLSYGSSGAKQATLSFWVKANKTGTYVCWFYQDDDTRICNATYTVNSSGTWEYKTITVPADAVGVIDNDNGLGLIVGWILAAGTDYTSGSAPTSWQSDVTADRYVGQSVNLADTIGNYWQITGVQLEVGDTATPFEHRSYGQELALAQRFFQKIGGTENNLIIGHSHTYSGGYSYGVFKYDAPMRAIPSGSVSTNAAGTWRYRYGSGLNVDNIATQVGIDQFGISQCRFFMGHGQAANTQGWIRGQSSASYVVLDAEL